MVVEAGGVARTINLCQTFFYERREQQGKEAIKGVKWKSMIDKKSSRRGAANITTRADRGLQKPVQPAPQSREDHW